MACTRLRVGMTPRRRAIVLGLALAGLAVVASVAQLHEWLLGLLPATEALVRSRPALGVSAFVLFAALSAMLAFVSSAVLVPVGIYAWGQAATTALLLLGWVLGGICAYSLSRFLGRAVVTTFVPAAMLERYEVRFSRRAPFGLVLLFQLALPSEVPGYLLGLVRYDVRKYLAALALAELPYAVATVSLGASFLERRITVLVVVGAVLLVFSSLTLAALHRRIRRQHRGGGAYNHQDTCS